MEIFAILFWLIGSVAAGYYAKRLNRSDRGWSLFSLLLSPILGFLLLFALGEVESDDDDGRIPCPFCAEDIKIEAILCPHCRSDLRATDKRMRL